MEWILGAVAVGLVFLYGRSHQWWGGSGSGPVVCDIETDMPDQMKQVVLAQVASQKDPSALRALADSLVQGGYVQAAYCLACRAWTLSGSKGTPPAPPTAAQIAAAAAVRSTSKAGNLGQMSLNQMQVAPGSPNMNVTAGTLVGVTGATPFDPTNNPKGFQVVSMASTLSVLSPTTFAIVGPGSVEFRWGDGTATVLTCTDAGAAAAVVAAAPAPATAPSAVGPAPVPPSAPAAVAAAAPLPPSMPVVPGLDPNAVAQAAQSLAGLAASTLDSAMVANVQPQGQ